MTTSPATIFLTVLESISALVKVIDGLPGVLVKKYYFTVGFVKNID